MLPKPHFDNLQVATQRTFLDKCKLGRRTAGAANDYGYTAETYPFDAYYTACGFAFAKTSEAENLSIEAPLADAYLRLPADTELTNLDRVQVTHIKGKELETPLVFDVVGEPNPLKGAGYKLQLKFTSETQNV